MRVSQAMSRDVRVAHPDQRIQEAASTMADIDAGVLPVSENDRLIGMVTDRDIAVRAVAGGKGPDTPVREVMTVDVKYCFEDDDLVDVSKIMADQQVRRLPVVDREQRLVGILALGDIAAVEGAITTGKAVEGISRPGGRHAT